MTCSSCSDSVAPLTAESLVPTPVIPSFNTNGSLELTNTGNLFVDLSPVTPFAISAINAYITSLAVAQKTLEPTFFNTPFLYSFSSNLVLGNFLESTVSEGKFITTTYVVPYQGYTKIETAIVVTILDTETKIVFFQIPKEFSYESVELAAVATVPVETGYNAIVQVPYSFIDKNVNNVFTELKIVVITPVLLPNSFSSLNADSNKTLSNAVIAACCPDDYGGPCTC